jgi:Crinkler effector protein N-terminal domain
LTTDILSAVFSDPLNQQHLHIVVRVPLPEPNLPREPEFDLNCLVLEGDGRVFSVKIPKSGSVDGLKKAIKKEKENAFREVDADSLDLWMVCILDDDRLMENVHKLNLVNTRHLKPTAKLSKVFADAPEDDHVHIIVRASA